MWEEAAGKKSQDEGPRQGQLDARGAAERVARGPDRDLDVHAAHVEEERARRWRGDVARLDERLRAGDLGLRAMGEALAMMSEASPITMGEALAALAPGPNEPCALASGTARPQPSELCHCSREPEGVSYALL